MTVVVPGTAGLRRGSPAWRRAAAAIFCAGLGTFSLLYAPQALLPAFASAFGVAPAAAALVFSAALAGLGTVLVLGGWVGDAWGRRRTITCALGIASLLMLAAAAAPSLDALLAVRVLQGIALAGVPPVVLAYLAAEVEPASLGLSVGLYVAGNAIGGMVGRFLAGALEGAGGWRVALAGLAVLGVGCWVLVVLLLPPARSPHAPPVPLRSLPPLLATAARDGVVARLAAVGALLGATFTAVFTSVTFRLTRAPFELDGDEVGAIFLLYLLGSVGSTIAGRLADSRGRRRILLASATLTLAGVAVTAAAALWLVLAGLAIVTFGFFAAHATASGWAGRRGGRTLASPSHATSLYLLAFYAGSALGGVAAAVAYDAAGWSGVVALTAVMLLAAVSVVGSS